MARTKNSKAGYSIGAVARITGLTDHTIRVWERRYKAVVARRTESGRRLYTAANVEKLGLLKQLTDKGIAIGKIAGKSNKMLRNAVLEYDEIAAKSLPDTVRIAILGDLVRTQLLQDPGPLEIAVANNSPQMFCADLEHQPVDVVIFETTIVDAETIKELQSYISLGRARCGVLVYNFGRKADVDRTVKSGIPALLSPVSVADIQATIRNLLAGMSVSKPESAQPEPGRSDPVWRFSATTAPRRFTRQQLARLANISSTIDCECPQNLAQLVSDLTAFEIYSAQCANRDAEDAALHHYLHQTCTQAREIIETALQKVIEAEGIAI